MVGDLYNLGSLLHYLITARMITPDIVATMRPEHRPRTAIEGSKDSYQVALPYWREALAAQTERISDAAPSRFSPGTNQETSLLLDDVRQLCAPDPMLLGTPNNRQECCNPFGLNAHI